MGRDLHQTTASADRQLYKTNHELIARAWKRAGKHTTIPSVTVTEEDTTTWSWVNVNGNKSRFAAMSLSSSSWFPAKASFARSTEDSDCSELANIAPFSPIIV